MFRHRRPRHLWEVLSAITGSPETPLWALAPWLAVVLLCNWLTNVLPWWGTLLLIGGLVVGFWGYFWWFPRGPMGLSVHIEPQKPKQVPGLILPVSPISPFKATQEEKDRLQQLLAAAMTDPTGPLSEEDQRLLDHSNLKPALAAVEYHYGADPNQSSAGTPVLRDVWIITTEDSQEGSTLGSNSVGVGHLLRRWFLSRHPDSADRVRFHLDSYERLSLRVGPLDYTGLAHLVDQIYKKAPYKDDQIIADITPGTKVISLAIAMGCLPPKRTMQYMSSQRAPQTGEVLHKGVLVPQLIDIDPYVEELG
ncbi:MAG TPA: hypothetical protein PK777_06030 [Thermoguttaceae bacterium]|nr:hypothetical protein [Thermoguttaceae bacterium]